MPGLDDTDPTDFEGIEGIGPVILPGQDRPAKEPRSNAATGASAAGVRAFTAQAIAFYFRAPVKAFFRTRVDYLTGKFSWKATTPGLLAYAVRNYGWRFIPEQVLPPLLANATIGAALYTSYLQILGRMHEPSGKASKIVYPPPPPTATFSAGLLAGGIQSFIAAPLDALQVRFDRREGRYNGKTVWQYSGEKLREIGVRGIFAGWGLSFIKDSLGSGVFFCTFEYTKNQAYYNFVAWYYGSLGEVALDGIAAKRGRLTSPASESFDTRGSLSASAQPTIRPHFALAPSFLFLAGVTASVAQQTVLHPLALLQTHHYARLEQLDAQAKRFAATSSSPGETRGRMLRAYVNAYRVTLAETRADAREAFGPGRLGVWRYLYRGFLWSTLRQVPSTSAGLIIFELVRRRYGLGSGEVRIQLEGGYDVLVT